MVCYRYIKRLHQALTELPQILFSDEVQCSLNALPSIDDCSLLTFSLLSQKSKLEPVKQLLLKQMQIICFRPINTGVVCLQGAQWRYLQAWHAGCDLSGVVANEHLGQHPPVLPRGISFVYGSRHLCILYCIEMQ